MDDLQRLATVSRFNDFINAQDIERLSQMMTDDHMFIDKLGNKICGRSACAQAWRGFFAAFPDYRNIFAQIFELGEFVVVVGRSTCSDLRLDGPALWTARLRDACLAEWRVLDDLPKTRSELGLAEG